MKKYIRERGKERTFKKKKSQKKRVLSNTTNKQQTTNTTVIHFSRGSLCVYIYTYIDLLGRARADVTVTVV